MMIMKSYVNAFALLLMIVIMLVMIDSSRCQKISLLGDSNTAIDNNSISNNNIDDFEIAMTELRTWAINCCHEDNDGNDKMNRITTCLKTIDRSRDSQIVAITYITPNIINYAQYSIPTNHLYFSLQNGISYQIYSPSTGSNYEPRDQRWNRVKLLSNLFRGEHRNKSYLIWLDADLMVTQFSWKIQDIIDEYKEFDIIISAEAHAETGIANTGCLIIKNSLWSLTFLDRWWSQYDHSIAHDQIFFSKLYKDLSPDIRDKHIKILPSFALNSIPPAYLYQQDHHPVLHLMGESNIYRKIVFSRGFDVICNTTNQLVGRMESGVRISYSNDYGGSLFPPQLGLARRELLSIVMNTYCLELRQALPIIQQSLLSDPLLNSDTHGIISNAASIREILLQIERIIQESKRSRTHEDLLLDLTNQIERISMDWRNFVSRYQGRKLQYTQPSSSLGILANIRKDLHTVLCLPIIDDMLRRKKTRHQDVTTERSSILISGLQLRATLANDFIDFLALDSSKRDLFGTIHKDLLALLELVDAESKPRVQELLAMHHQHYGQYLLQSAAIGNKAAEADGFNQLELALNMFLSMKQYANSYRISELLFFLGSSYCEARCHRRGRGYLFGMLALMRSESLEDISIVQDKVIDLIRGHLNIAWCTLNELTEQDSGYSSGSTCWSTMLDEHLAREFIAEKADPCTLETILDIVAKLINRLGCNAFNNECNLGIRESNNNTVDYLQSYQLLRSIILKNGVVGGCKGQSVDQKTTKSSQNAENTVSSKVIRRKRKQPIIVV